MPQAHLGRFPFDPGATTDSGPHLVGQCAGCILLSSGHQNEFGQRGRQGDSRHQLCWIPTQIQFQQAGKRVQRRADQHGIAAAQQQAGEAAQRREPAAADIQAQAEVYFKVQRQLLQLELQPAIHSALTSRQH